MNNLPRSQSWEAVVLRLTQNSAVLTAAPYLWPFPHSDTDPFPMWEWPTMALGTRRASEGLNLPSWQEESGHPHSPPMQILEATSGSVPWPLHFFRPRLSHCSLWEHPHSPGGVIHSRARPGLPHPSSVLSLPADSSLGTGLRTQYGKVVNE